jgi:hypothetical protein
MNAVKDTAFFIELANHYSKALDQCKGLQAFLAYILRLEDFTALWRE